MGRNNLQTCLGADKVVVRLWKKERWLQAWDEEIAWPPCFFVSSFAFGEQKRKKGVMPIEETVRKNSTSKKKGGS